MHYRKNKFSYKGKYKIIKINKHKAQQESEEKPTACLVKPKAFKRVLLPLPKYRSLYSI